MTNFQTWEQRNLAKFAAEANKMLEQQREEIKALRDDLRVALDAYRKLLTKEETK
jgi:ribosomal protein S4